MQKHIFILTIMLGLGINHAHATQLLSPNNVQKENSIIKNVASSLKSPSSTSSAVKTTALEQLIQNNEQKPATRLSNEEHRAFALLNTANPTSVLGQNRKMSSFLQKLFGG